MKQRILSKSQSPAMIVSGYEQPSRQSRVRRTVLLAAPLIVATLLILPAAINVRVVEYDEAIFLDVARNIQRSGLPLRSMGEQGVFFFDHTLLCPYLLAVFSGPSASHVLLARLITAATGLGCVLLTFLIGVYLLAAIAYLFAVPPWERPDEPAHYGYIAYVAEEGRLPVPSGESPLAYRQIGMYEWHHPPLYYLAQAALLRSARAWLGEKWGQIPPLLLTQASLSRTLRGASWCRLAGGQSTNPMPRSLCSA
jgi:hypothetical protein